MILKGSLGSYGVEFNHFWLHMNEQERRENGVADDMIQIRCQYEDSLLDLVDSPDRRRFRLQHMLGDSVMVEGEMADDGTLTARSLQRI
jgi:hypothetical protein